MPCLIRSVSNMLQQQRMAQAWVLFSNEAGMVIVVSYGIIGNNGDIHCNVDGQHNL
jgi:hypothetical protein